MMIMANDTRSRRNWMNSFSSMAQVLRQKPLPGMPARRLRGDEMRHWKLSRALPIRSMNTSSKDGSERFQSRPLRLR